MARRPGKANAFWPEDHWSRRTYALDWVNGTWVMRADSVFGPLPLMPQWVGHNYGHHIIEDENGHPWMFYERVSEEVDGSPTKTEIFARKLDHGHGLVGDEVSILKIPNTPWPAAQRQDGTLLIEGARPFKFGKYYMLTFSAGDYFTDTYGIHLAWSKKLRGPYKPFLTAKGNLKNFARVINKKMPMTWGPARAAFFEAQGRLWMLFHGIEKATWTPTPDGLRNIYLSPVDIDIENEILVLQ